MHHINQYDFAVKSVFEFLVLFSAQITMCMYAFHSLADNDFSAERIRYRLTAEMVRGWLNKTNLSHD